MDHLKLKKWNENPILRPTGKDGWEKVQVCNPGAWYEDGKVYLLYRAAGEFEDYRIQIGLAISEDGFHFKRISDKPVIAPSEKGFDAGLIEDPRIVKMGDTFYVTYACRAFPYYAFAKGKIKPDLPPNSPAALVKNLTRTGLASSGDLRSFKKLGPITSGQIDNRDVMLFPEKVDGRYAMLHRPIDRMEKKQSYKSRPPGIWLAYSDDLLHWGDECLIAEPKFDWESKIGGSCPPIKTERGWLTLYHGVDEDHVYRAGVMILALDDPRRILYRSPHFIMEPEAPFEKEGFVPNVVFPCGNVVINDTLFVYYGGADTVCCVATIAVDELLEYVMRFPEKA